MSLLGLKGLICNWNSLCYLAPKVLNLGLLNLLLSLLVFFFCFQDKKQYPTLSLSNQCQCKWVASSYNMLGLPCYGQMLKEKGKKGSFRNVCVQSVEYPFYQGFQEGPAAGETRGLFHVNSPPIELRHSLRLT